ncbi:hypothetical protein ABZP36_006421, partial [Zizania latifolia]
SELTLLPSLLPIVAPLPPVSTRQNVRTQKNLAARSERTIPGCRASSWGKGFLEGGEEGAPWRRRTRRINGGDGDVGSGSGDDAGGSGRDLYHVCDMLLPLPLRQEVSGRRADIRRRRGGEEGPLAVRLRGARRRGWAGEGPGRGGHRGAAAEGGGRGGPSGGLRCLHHGARRRGGRAPAAAVRARVPPRVRRHVAPLALHLPALPVRGRRRGAGRATTGGRRGVSQLPDQRALLWLPGRRQNRRRCASSAAAASAATNRPAASVGGTHRRSGGRGGNFKNSGSAAVAGLRQRDAPASTAAGCPRRGDGSPQRREQRVAARDEATARFLMQLPPSCSSPLSLTAIEASTEASVHLPIHIISIVTKTWMNFGNLVLLPKTKNMIQELRRLWQIKN